ncbi:MAG TPA: energy-coupling factor transporter transmembrane component T, partial [Oscillatoriaceae cyanobacterium]
LSYRSFFLLLERWNSTAAAMRLRGGWSWRRMDRSIANLGSALGSLLVTALARGEALYDAMRVRGYRGRIGTELPWSPRANDALPLLPGAVGFGLSVARSDRAAPYVLLVLLILFLLGEGRRRWRP